MALPETTPPFPQVAPTPAIGLTGAPFQESQELFLMGCVLARKDRPIGRNLLDEARRYHKQSHAARRAFSRTLVDMQYATDAEIAKWLAEFHRTRVVAGAELTPRGDARSALAESMSRQRHALCLDIDRRMKKATVAISDPETPSFNQIKYALDGLVITYVFAQHGDLSDAILKNYTAQVATAGDNDLERLVETMIREAADMRVSDIHFIPEDSLAKIIFRVDGDLVPYRTFPADLKDKMTAQLKLATTRGDDGIRQKGGAINGGVMDISTKDRPQDANGTRTFGSKKFALRFSSLPVLSGESIVIRLLDQQAQVISLGDLGLLPDMTKLLTRMVKMPHGLVCIIGPTGHGKSTTLAAALKLIDPNLKTVFSAEDPVEYRLRGVRQAQITEKMSFSDVLRTILRQNPEVVLVGEMRDEETTAIAVRAANTGHLIPTTLHANSAVQGVNRLLDLKIKPSLITATLRLLFAQRLVRRLCVHCRRPHDDNEKLLKEYADIIEVGGKAGVFSDPETGNGQKPAFWAAGGGCVHCNNTGFKGRLCIAEARPASEGLNLAIRSSVEESDFDDYAAEQTYVKRFNEGDFICRNMRQDGVIKAALGWTDIENVYEATVELAF
jgi:type II secretory ATPase GspE/PulE/Tfp pilus assembly ATPase PilB-like protein